MGAAFAQSAQASRAKPDGYITPAYRREVSEFQLWEHPVLMHAKPDDPRLGKVDELTQDALIRRSHTVPLYIDWIQHALTKVGIPTPVTSVLDSKTVQNIKAYQNRPKNDLRADGWIGAKTETKLWRESGLFPPGSDYNEKPVPVPDRPWHEGKGNMPYFQRAFMLRVQKDFMNSVEKPFANVTPNFRRVYSCIAFKILDKRYDYYDTNYLTVRSIDDYLKKGKATFDQIDALTNDAKKEIERDFKNIYSNTSGL